jgi:uncharacterized protein YecT (DUF1311 family)
MFRALLAAGCIAVLAVPSVFALDSCANPQTSYDRTYCTAKLFIQADTEMGNVYVDFKKSLNPDQKQKLTQAQRDWIVFRDRACEKAGMINVTCNYQVLRERMQFLSDRYRECKTGHCREDLMYQENWQVPVLPPMAPLPSR